MPAPARASVVLVHRLYMNGWDQRLLAHRLARAGFRVRIFRYPTLRERPLENGRALAAYAAGAGPVHFVAHSLGGLVVRHALAQADLPPGRVVTLGTPHTGSSAAAWLSVRGWGRPLLGRALDQGLLGGAPDFPPAWQTGAIAGTLRLGLGMVIPGIPRPNDGTVAVAETALPGCADRLVLPVSHFGLLVSARVAQAAGHFLDHGRFAI